LKSARAKLDIINAFRDVGTYRGAAAICGTTHKTVKRIVEAEAADQAGAVAGVRASGPANYEGARALVAAKVEATQGRITAKRLLPVAVAAGYAGSARNFRRLVAEEKAKRRRVKAAEHQRRPAVWSPGEHLVIDWGVLGGLHVFCAVLAWSRVRFVRFATDERAETTFAMLAECFETLGGVPKVVLADRMSCLKGGVVADLVIPTPAYVRFATHYRFRPDFCQARDPASKGIVENLVGYAKTDLMIPLGVLGGPVDLDVANTAAAKWCREVNASSHSEIAAIPTERLLASERVLLGVLPSLRLSIGRRETRKVDRLSCVRFASGRYSVPSTLVGTVVEVLSHGTSVMIVDPTSGEVVAEHVLVAPGGASVDDAHYPTPRPTLPARAIRARTAAEKAFCALGSAAEGFLRGAAAAGHTRVGYELDELSGLEAAHGRQPLLDALRRATAFGRFKAADVRSILAAGTGIGHDQPAGDALVIELPTVATRSLSEYTLQTLLLTTDEGGEL